MWKRRHKTLKLLLIQHSSSASACWSADKGVGVGGFLWWGARSGTRGSACGGADAAAAASRLSAAHNMLRSIFHPVTGLRQRGGGGDALTLQRQSQGVCGWGTKIYEMQKEGTCGGWSLARRFHMASLHTVIIISPVRQQQQQQETTSWPWLWNWSLQSKCALLLNDFDTFYCLLT